jgi:integrase
MADVDLLEHAKQKARERAEEHLRGVPMAVIAKWLGHADASITARIYAHSQDEALRSASATLGQVVTPGG